MSSNENEFSIATIGRNDYRVNFWFMTKKWLVINTRHCLRMKINSKYISICLKKNKKK